MPEDGRPDPDALIAAAAAEARGRLKIILGAAPGVGKTWDMLAQAQRRQAEGVDVLAGVIETHGRADTEAQLAGLPLLPRRTIAYRGQTLEEFDLDAALARRPGLLLVDELAHTNAPGSRHAKRWEDVAELIAAGINVWATLNVQHLESLNDDVARITGVRVAETLPDRVLEMADEIELIDVTPAELRDRLRDGKIYRPDTARRALDGFFREGNLAALREIALRRAAAHVDGDLRDWMRRAGVAGPWPAAERVLALIGPDAAAEAVVRQAKRLADALRAPWTALHVERDTSVTGARPALALAAQLGAEIEIRAGADLVGTTIALARAVNATHIIMGRAPAPLWRRLAGRTLAIQLLRAAPDFTLHVISLPGAAPRPRRVARGGEGILAWLIGGGVVAAATGAGLLLPIPPEAMGMVYLFGVVVGAGAGGLRVAGATATAAFLCWDFFFLPPLYEVTISRPGDVIALVIFAAVALLTGGLASRVQMQSRAAQARIDGLRRIAKFSRTLGQAASEPDLLAELARQACGIAGRAVALSGVADDLAIRAAEPPADGAPGASLPEPDPLDEGAWAAARWCWSHQEPTGAGTGTLPGASWRFAPLATVRGRLGVLGVRSPRPLDETQTQALAALADQAAVAWERVRLTAESARTAAMEETQRLRTALLASLGHDLRTPLAGIQGAAGTLRQSWDALTPDTRADLLDSIEQDVGRMARFLANINELTRLEGGQIVPRLSPVRLAEVVEAAIARLEGAPHVGVRLPEPPVSVMADPALLEVVLVNVLENAVKFSPGGSLVLARATVEAGEVALSVLDEGIGIPPDDLTNVFDSFFRTRRGDRVAPGTGLGLAIARGMIEAMGGRISAQSPRPDMPRDGSPGCVITIRLPLA
jgi:two-component system sensor histidine kinase KdpD